MTLVIGTKSRLSNWLSDCKLNALSISYADPYVSPNEVLIEDQHYYLVDINKLDMVRGKFFTDVLILGKMDYQDFYDFILHPFAANSNNSFSFIMDKAIPYLKNVPQHLSENKKYDREYSGRWIIDEINYICECGAHSAGIEAHSTWCPIYKQEETG